MTGVSHAAMSLLASEKNLIAISSSCSAQHANILPPLKSGSDWASLAQCLTNIAARLPPTHLPTRIGPSILPLCDALISNTMSLDARHRCTSISIPVIQSINIVIAPSSQSPTWFAPAEEPIASSRLPVREDLQAALTVASPLCPTLSGTSRSRAAPACSLPPGMVLTPGFMHV